MAAMSSAERFDRLIGIAMNGNTDGWWVIKEEMDY
jgi:hypothetical protein